MSGAAKPRNHGARNYAGKVEIKRAVEAARASGIDVGGLEVTPAGAIRVLDRRRTEEFAETDFDRLDREGRL